MAAELNKYLLGQLTSLPVDHPDRPHLIRMLSLNENYLNGRDMADVSAKLAELSQNPDFLAQQFTLEDVTNILVLTPKTIRKYLGAAGITPRRDPQGDGRYRYINGKELLTLAQGPRDLRRKI